MLPFSTFILSGKAKLIYPDSLPSKMTTEEVRSGILSMKRSDAVSPTEETASEASTTLTRNLSGMMDDNEVNTWDLVSVEALKQERFKPDYDVRVETDFHCLILVRYLFT